MNDGWVKLKDPASGKEFYANKITRETQWDTPKGFVDPGIIAQQQQQRSNSFVNSATESDLPPNWERLTDEASGKCFYVDHVNKVTTWEHPGKSIAAAGNSDIYGQQQVDAKPKGTATGFGFIPETATTSYGSGNATAASTTTARTNTTSSTTSRNWGMSNPPPSTAHAHTHSHLDSSSYSSYKPSSNAVDDKSTEYYSSVLPKIDFSVVKVPDKLRSCCPSCDMIFTLSKRRHHCRLCGDVFCDSCSSHRVLLPLGGTEFDKPVRVCNECHVDVDNGNYFSMRRYLTPLLLVHADNEEEVQRAFNAGSRKNDDGSAVEIMDNSNVSAALTSLTQDLESVLQDSSSFEEKVTIPPDVLVPAITRHLGLEETSDRAIKALTTLLTLANVVGDNSFAATVYFQKEANVVFEQICKILEWSGTHMKTLAVQEQAVKAMFYLTDGRVIADILAMEEADGSLLNEGWINSAVMICDMPRVLRIMLDHATCTSSTTLQRWSAACLRSLIIEDERRGCESISEAMSMGYSELRYEPFVTELVSSGGAMILSSLIASDDADTRAHAMSALSQIIDSAREINIRIGVYIEAYQVHNVQTCSETAIIDAIVSSGACGPSLAQLLLSADNSSAAMACDFAKSLVYPIISNPKGSGIYCYHRNLPSDINLSIDEDGLKQYRQAALDIGSNDGVLSALVHLVTSDGSQMRPVELRKSAMEILAGVTHTIAYWDSRIKSAGKSIKTMNESVLRLHEKLGIVITILEDENAADYVMTAFSSPFDSLNTSRDSPVSQLKEVAALTLSALSSFSVKLIKSIIARNILPTLISISMDDGFNSPSKRGGGRWSSRSLPMLEAVASILVQSWKLIQNDAPNQKLQDEFGDGSSSVSLQVLFEALDAGIIPLLSRILNSPQEFQPRENVYAETRMRIAACHCVAALFGIGRCDSSKLGLPRVFEAMGNRHRIIPEVLYQMGLILPEVQKRVSQGISLDKDLPLTQLLEAVLIASGSTCGSEFLSFGSMEFSKEYDLSSGLGAKNDDVFSTQFQEVCTSTCDIVTKSNFLPSALVGAFGEALAMPTLRLVSSLADNASSKRSHQQLVRSGVLGVLADMLRNAMNGGDYYVFDACVVTIGRSGPEMNSSSENNSIQGLRECVKLFSNILLIDEQDGSSNAYKLQMLKSKCIKAVEMLSTNSSLWTVIVAHFIPGFMERWLSIDVLTGASSDTISLVLAGLNTILRVIALPSHAVFIANTGIAANLCNMIIGDEDSNAIDSRVEGKCVHILHVLLSYSGKKGPLSERIEPGVVDIYALDVACSLLSKNEHSDYNIAISNTKIGLEILLNVISGLNELSQHEISTSPQVVGFVETVSNHKIFLKKLCASLIGYKASQDGELDIEDSLVSLFGSPIYAFEGACGAFTKSTDAALHCLFWIAFFSSVAQTQSSEVIWETFMLDDDDISDQSLKVLAICALSANFMNILEMKECPCFPFNKKYQGFYETTATPVVQERLLHSLSTGASSFDFDDDERKSSYFVLLKHFHAPRLCLEATKNPLLIVRAFDALQNCLAEFPLPLLEDLVSTKDALNSLFGLLSISESSHGDLELSMIGRLRVFAVSILSSSGELHVLGPVVNREGLRGFAIASLSAACLLGDGQVGTLAEDLTEEGSSMSMLCLHALVDILSADAKKDHRLKILLSPAEAQALSDSLGQKLSSMVLERFMHKVERETVLGDCGDDESIQRYPEVTLLCALASSREALRQLCNCGGLEALSLVAGEGELSAINSLLEVCKIDSALVITADAHTSAIHVISSDDASARAKKASFELLVQISSQSRSGRDAISQSENSVSCIEFASDLIKDLADDLKEVEDANEKERKESDFSQVSIELEAISFVSNLVSNANIREVLLSDDKLLSAIEDLAKESVSYQVQHVSLLFLANATKWVITSTEVSNGFVDTLVTSLLSVLDSSQIRQESRQSNKSSGLSSFGDFSKSHEFNENLILASTCQVLAILFPKLSHECMVKVMETISRTWNDTLNFHIFSTKKTASKTRNGGLLMYNISSILLLSVGSESVQEFMNEAGNIEDILRFIIVDPEKIEKKSKQVDSVDSSSTDLMFWKGARTQALQCLATLTNNLTYKSKDGMSWEALISHIEENSTSKQANKIRTFALSQQSKVSSRRRLGHALDEFIQNSSDQVGIIAARRIQDNLFLL